MFAKNVINWVFDNVSNSNSELRRGGPLQCAEPGEDSNGGARQSRNVGEPGVEQCLEAGLQPQPLIRGQESATRAACAGFHQGWGDIVEMENSCYGFLLRLITDITEYYGYYGVLLRILLNVTDTEIAITEHYGILRSVISPPDSRHGLPDKC